MNVNLDIPAQEIVCLGRGYCVGILHVEYASNVSNVLLNVGCRIPMAHRVMIVRVTHCMVITIGRCQQRIRHGRRGSPT